MNNKKSIIAGAVILILVIVVVAVIALNGNNSNDNTALSTTVGSEQAINETGADSEKTTSSDGNVSDDETNYWDNVEVYEETTDSTTTKAKSKKTKRTKETEAYAGEDDGWSPLVPADDVE
jgi:hypothetical protein